MECVAIEQMEGTGAETHIGIFDIDIALLFGDMDLSEFDLPENPDDYVTTEQEAETETALA